MSNKLLLEILIIQRQNSTLSEIQNSLNNKIFNTAVFSGTLTDLEDAKLAIYDAIIIENSLNVTQALEFGLHIRSFQQFNHIPIICIIDNQSSIYDYQVIKHNVWFVHEKFIASSLEKITKSALKSHKLLFQSKFIKYKDLILNTQTQELHRNGKVVSLSSIEYRIMELLLRYPSHVFSREDIITQAWNVNNEDPMSTRAVDTHVNRLRNLLKIHLNVYDLIKTIRAQGYCISFGNDDYDT